MTRKAHKTITVLGFCRKGPVNVPTRISTLADLAATFGPGPDPLVLTASALIQGGQAVTVIRAGDPKLMATARIPVLGAGGVPCLRAAEKEPYVYPRTKFFRWRLDGRLAPKILVAMPTAGISAADLAAELNDQLAPADRIQFLAADGHLTVRPATPHHARLELVAVQDSLYGPWSVTRMGDEMAPGAVIGSTTGPVNLTDYDDFTLPVRVHGSGNVLADGATQTIRLRGLIGRTCTVAEVCQYLNMVELPLHPGGWAAVDVGGLGLATRHTGADAAIEILPSVGATLFGLKTGRHHGATHAVAEPFVGAADAPSFWVEAATPGSHGDDLRIEIKGDFSLEVWHRGGRVEHWDRLAKTGPRAVADVVNASSKWVRVTDNPATYEPPKPGHYAPATPGSDGPADTPLLELAAPAVRAANPDILCVPGQPHTPALDGPWLTVLDAPADSTGPEAAAYAKDKAGPVLWPWVLYRDPYSRANVWVPPCGPVVAALAGRTDQRHVVLPGVQDVMSREGAGPVTVRPYMADSYAVRPAELTNMHRSILGQKK